MRKALIVGINYYQHNSQLFGCVKDAEAVQGALEWHGDKRKNFDVKVLMGEGRGDNVSRDELYSAITDVFAGDSDVALFYFAGHGHIAPTGGYLLSSECRSGHDGISLADVVALANASTARNRIIVLDSCHSGIAAASPRGLAATEINEGVTVLTASSANQYATEENNRGVFTTIFVDALNGAAADLLGSITPGSVYAHIDQSLGTWEQRPVFKANVMRFISLRQVSPPIELEELRRITELFPTADYLFKLDPTFEPDMVGRTEGVPPPDPINAARYSVLQKYYRVNLVVPVNARSMWHAAMGSTACRLTALGEHYRRLRVKKRI